MITREQISIAFGEDRQPYKTKDVDPDVRAISLLRERIPYDVCKRIISSATHDVIYLCDIKDSIPYLDERDLDVLADCNVWAEPDFGCFALFI